MLPPPTPLLSGQTFAFVGLLTIYSPYWTILRIVHTIKISSEKRILKVSSFRKLCRTQFANFILLLFSKSVRAGSTLFLYERYPRACFKILTRDPLEISQFTGEFSAWHSFFTFHSFFHLLDHSFDPAKCVNEPKSGIN